MTPVEFRFLTPTGNPISNALIEIQLTKGVIEDLYPGVVMPRLITVTTDNEGSVVVDLYPSDIPYMVSVYDSESDAGLFYKFFVPELAAGVTQVRLQDIIVDREMSNTSYDEAALLSIHNAKSNAIAASTAAQGFAEAAAAASSASQVVLVRAEELSAELLLAKGQVVASAQEAQTSKISAAASAATASAAASTAQAQSSIASTKASEAEASAQAALASEQGAAGSATSASASASTATTKATEALNSAAVASTHATTATLQAAAATTKANEAWAHATNAETSKTAAATSAASAASSATTVMNSLSAAELVGRQLQAAINIDGGDSNAAPITDVTLNCGGAV